MDDAYWRKTDGPMPGVCRPANPNPRRDSRPAPAAIRPSFTPPISAAPVREAESGNCLIGLSFIWDNGQSLEAGLPCTINAAAGQTHHLSLN